MKEDILEWAQLWEIIGIAALVGVGLFYTMWGRNTESRGYYRNVMILAAVVTAVCAVILNVVN